jgi:uncharacterized membrane protein
VADRMTKWFIFTILFAFIPITISLLFTYLSNIQRSSYDFIGEILFFTIMVSSTSLSDVVSLNKKVQDFILTIFIGFFILLVLSSSILYGSILYGQINNITSELFNSRVFSISLTLAIISGILGTIIQILLGRTEVST